jgi:hypothetical protein
LDLDRPGTPQVFEEIKHTRAASCKDGAASGAGANGHPRATPKTIGEPNGICDWPDHFGSIV